MDILGRFGEKFYRPDFPLTPYVFVEKFVKIRERKQIRITKKNVKSQRLTFNYSLSIIKVQFSILFPI